MHYLFRLGRADMAFEENKNRNIAGAVASEDDL